MGICVFQWVFQEAYPILIGDMDPSGNLSANIIHAPSENLRTKMMVMVEEGKWKNYQLTADYKGRVGSTSIYLKVIRFVQDYTASMTTANPDLFNGSGMGIFHYLQAVTPRLNLGAELAYQAAPHIPGGHIGVLAAKARCGDMAMG
jgi:mitochondrial import receptor subunit TOM40